MKTFVSPHFEVIQLNEFQTKANFYKDFVGSQFKVIYVYKFQTNSNSYEDICRVLL